MNSYSPYINKYLKKILDSGYSVRENGSQLYRDEGDFEVLISDLTVKSLFQVETLLVWIKDKKTKVIIKEMFFRNELLPLKFKKVDKKISLFVQDLNIWMPESKKEIKGRFLAKDLLHEINS